jgi:hypothetical protein
MPRRRKDDNDEPFISPRAVHPSSISVDVVGNEKVVKTRTVVVVDIIVVA